MLVLARVFALVFICALATPLAASAASVPYDFDADHSLGTTTGSSNHYKIIPVVSEPNPPAPIIYSTPSHVVSSIPRAVGVVYGNNLGNNQWQILQLVNGKYKPAPAGSYKMTNGHTFTVGLGGLMVAGSLK